jgi:hypothetical protein
MVPVSLARLEPSRIDAIEDWRWLDQDMLRSSRSRQICMTCHFFRHHPGPNCNPLPTRRCSSWIEDLQRYRGWPPEVA